LSTKNKDIDLFIMLSNGLRRQFYKLHSGNGAARLIADSASWAFMTGVKLLHG